MKKLFLAIATLFLWVSHPSFAINNSKAASKHTKSSLKSSVKLHPAAHTTTKKTIAKNTPAKKTKTTLKKTIRKSKTIHKTTHKRKGHATSIKPAKLHKLRSKKPIKKNTHHPRYSVPQVKPPLAQLETDFSWGGNNISDNTTTSVKQHVTAFAHKTVATLHYSSYKFGGNRFDPQHGIYMLDCSSYVDNLLNKSSPQAYSTLARWSGSPKPNSEHYYNFFNRLADHGGYGTWDTVEDTQKLQPGDILVFRYKNSRGGLRGGHVMLVMDKLVERNANIVQVRVADSAITGHSADTRGSRSGIGIGTLLLKVNPNTGQPYAFAWRVGSPWNSHVNIAMGRPDNV